MRASRFLYPPLRVAVPFFDPFAFKPKTDLKVTNTTLISVLKEKLCTPLYKDSIFVRRNNDFLIVVKGKVCGYYSPVLSLPPPLPHTALASEDMIIKGGLSVQQYVRCLESLDDLYRSFFLCSMETGFLFFVMDKEGRIPPSSKLGLQVLDCTSYGVKKTNDAVSDQYSVSEEDIFAPRFASDRKRSLTDEGRVDGFMRPGNNSLFFRDALDVLESCYSEEIDTCPTWWRRISQNSSRSKEKPLIEILSGIARHIGKDSSDEVDDFTPREKFPMNLTDDRRWVSCPVVALAPGNLLKPNKFEADPEMIRRRMVSGFLKLDF